MILNIFYLRQVLSVAAMILCPSLTWAQKEDASVVLENNTLRWEIGADGLNRHFVDKTTGKDWLRDVPATPIGAMRKGTTVTPCTKAWMNGSTLHLLFAGAEAEASVRVTLDKRYLTMEVLAFSGKDIDELTFLDVPMRLHGSLDEPFAACALAFNLQTNVPGIPGSSARLQAMCYPRFGIQGAKVAVLACPTAELREVMKEAVATAEDLPKTNIGGPWALDSEMASGSYLFDFGTISEKTVDDWIATVKQLGLNQINFHTGTSLRFGDCFPNPKIFPNGRSSVKAVIDKLHASGISAGLHTYSFFIAKDSPYVSPVPDPRLGKDRMFTLAETIPADTTTIRVAESTSDMNTVMGFNVRNSITVQIDDELITYTGISKEAPFGFTDCKRGAFNTMAQVHREGTTVSHLKECFGLFTPDADSTLLTEVAYNTAETFNECGFDMIYLDALDGEDILAGSDLAWHYGSKFVFEIARHLKRPALFEMSTFHHHLWFVRSRMGAWDHSRRVHKSFVDTHVASNNSGAGSYLPMNLGWWAVQTWVAGSSALWNEPTYPDDIEYLMTKCLAKNFSISLMGITPETLKSVPAYERLAPIFHRYENLRHAKAVPKTILDKLAEPGKEFSMSMGTDGAATFCPVEFTKHKVQGLNDWSNTWTVRNNYTTQIPKLRIEALYATAPYDAVEGTIIEDFSQPGTYHEHQNASGVQVSIVSTSDGVKGGSISGLLTGKCDRPVPVGSFGSVAREFSTPLNMANKEAMGLWVYGDGKGETLNFQVMSPGNTATRCYGDHHISINFTGWRYFELIEIDNSDITNHGWPYQNAYYAVFRNGIDYSQISQISFWYNDLPQGQEVSCSISPIKALPLFKSKLANPKLTIGTRTVIFPVQIDTGSYLEYSGQNDCKLYGPRGELITEISPQGELLSLDPGDNAVNFTCEPTPGISSRARISICSRGGPLTK